MQTEARISALNTGHGAGGAACPAASMDGGTRKYHHQRQSRSKNEAFNQQSQIGTLSHLLAGGVAGAVSKTCTAPLARLTILFQVQGMHSDVAILKSTSLWHEASRIVYEEGFTAFWRGNLVTIVHHLPYSSISFYTYECYKNILQNLPGFDIHRDYASADVCVRLLSGGLAGITAASVTYPLDLVRTRIAAQVFGHGNIWISKLKLNQELLIIVIQAPILSEWAWLVLMITLMMASNQVFQTNTIYYRGISHALYAICREEGVRGLYKGLGPTLMGVGPSIAISFSIYEPLISHWLSQRPQDSSVLVSLGCGSLSGVASSTVTFPLDLVRRRKQLEGAGGRAQVYRSGLIGTFRHIIQTEGFRGLYRGILPEYYKVVPSVGIVFMTYETLKNILLGGLADK